MSGLRNQNLIKFIMVMGEGELRIRKRSPFDETSYLGLPPDTQPQS